MLCNTIQKRSILSPENGLGYINRADLYYNELNDKKRH